MDFTLFKSEAFAVVTANSHPFAEGKGDYVEFHSGGYTFYFECSEMDEFAVVYITEHYIDDLIGLDGPRALGIMHILNKESDLVKFRLTSDEIINATIQSVVPPNGYTHELHLAMVSKLIRSVREANKHLKLLKPPKGK